MEEYSLSGHEKASSVAVVDDNNHSNTNYAEKGDEGEDDQGSKTIISGGVINTLISNLVTPLKEGYFKEAVKGQEEEQQISGDDDGSSDAEEGWGGGGGGGGNINSFITSFFHQNEAHEVHEKEEGTKGGRTGDDDHHHNGGGIINHLVSSLPVSLPENVSPAPDEASILIHSIIHD